MAEEGDNQKIDGVEKAAILLLTLGEDIASQVLKYLGATEVQKIGSKMTKIENLTQEKLKAVAEDFKGEMTSNISVGGNEYIRSVLTKALGEERADMVIDRIIEGVEGSSLDALKWMEPKLVADMVRSEHPQTIAVILAHLEPEQGSQIISYLRPDLRSEVIMRLATMESIAPGAMKELEESIKHQLAGNPAVHNKSIGGVKVAAEILNQMESSTESAIVSDIEKMNGELATSIQEQMFVFADLAKVDDRGIQTMLKEVSNDQLAIAFKVADDDLKEKFFKNMSERARDMLKEDMETRGPVKLSEVEKAQQDIVKIARRLAEEGNITIGGKGGEEVLV